MSNKTCEECGAKIGQCCVEGSVGGARGIDTYGDDAVMIQGSWGVFCSEECLETARREKPTQQFLYAPELMRTMRGGAR